MYTTFDVNIGVVRTYREHSVNRHRISSLCYAFTLHAAYRKPSLQPVFDVPSMAQRILKIEGKFWYKGGLRNLSKSIFSPPNPPPPPGIDSSLVSGPSTHFWAGAQHLTYPHRGQGGWNPRGTHPPTHQPVQGLGPAIPHLHVTFLSSYHRGQKMGGIQTQILTPTPPGTFWTHGGWGGGSLGGWGPPVGGAGCRNIHTSK